MVITGSKIMVIGGAGFIGSHIVDLLLKEDVEKVIVYDNFSRGTMYNLELASKDDRCVIYNCDILDTCHLEDAMSGCDGVIHLAAVWLLQCQDYPKEAFDVNIKGTFNVLDACVKHKIKRLIYSSSASVYGNAVEKPMTEDHPYNNQTFYGATKIAGEHMFKAFHKRYGLDGACLRYMNVYGPRQDYKGAYTSVIMKAIDSIKKGIAPIVYGNGSQSFDFIDVLDVARANILSLKSDIPFGFYNIGSGIGTSIKDLVGLIFDIYNSDLEIEYKDVGEEFVTDRFGDITKSRDDLNFMSEISLSDGLRKLIEWRNI